MILRRVIDHFRKQEWTAIAIDFVIVVLGVFVGLQVSNWNAMRTDRIRAESYLQRIGSDLDSDIAAVEARLAFWGKVADYGAQGLEYAGTGETGGRSNWEILLAYFQASQVAELVPAQATYDELKSAGELGLIADSAFRSALTNYYIFTASATVTERPPYRHDVRGHIPIEIQNYIWDNCYASDEDLDQTMHDCESPIDEARAAAIIEVISTDQSLMKELRYWMSTMHVAGIIGRARLKRAVSLRADVPEQVEK